MLVFKESKWLFYGLDYKVGKSDFSTMTCMREASLEVLNHMSEFLTNLYSVFFNVLIFFVNWHKSNDAYKLVYFCK